MAYFATPFRVLFHDTMAYGSHHFLTNFKFQCAAREEFLFGEVINGDPESKAAFDEIALLTQQAYSRNLAPVEVGETVGILMSYEDPTPSSLRFCFRVVRRDGTPVSCGFQTMVCMSQKTQALVSPPQALLRYYSLLAERLDKPNFSERVLTGRLQTVFDDESIALGKAIAAEPRGGYRIVGDLGSTDQKRNVRQLPPKLERGLVLLLPGQGSYHPALFAQLRQIDPQVESLFNRVDEIAQSVLGAPFGKLANAGTAQAQQELLRQYPDLTQLGIYLGGVVAGRSLLDNGLRPDVLVGHSAGELAALALGGAYSVETGAEVICHRIAALAAAASNAGGMVALGCDARRAAGLIDALGPGSLEIAVLNHSSQTIVSGTSADLERLRGLATHVGVPCQDVQSRYPFHSQLLRPAVDRFASALGELKAQAPAIAVYSPIEKSFYAEGDRLATLLPSHFVRPLPFAEAMNELFASGARTFVECGGGDILTRLVRRTFEGNPDVHAFSTLPAGMRARPAVGDVLKSLQNEPGIVLPVTADAPSRQPPEHAPTGEVPIAIVALGSVLPGAKDPDSLWQNVLNGTSGIRDIAKLVPEYAKAFLSNGDIVPDKTYTLLGGMLDRSAIGELPAEVRAIADASSSARLLAAATAQCLAGIKQQPDPKRTHFLVGSTADGSVEHDEALLIEGLISLSGSLDQPADSIAKLQRALRGVFDRPPENAERLAPHPSMSAVAEALIGAETKVVAIDAACASSLYALGLAANALRDGECDVAFAGGVFAAGPANGCLFAQFRGLSSTGSRPFDAKADGVVFCSGAAIAMCKRLPDALRDGDRIIALIRGIGTSSDGKSPSVAEPKRLGQSLAIRRAYAATGIDPATVQYVEAHATSTPVGDAVEFDALAEVFGAGAGERAPIVLGSVKALIGHTGWAAGAASLVKVCHALNEKQFPPQANFTSPNPNINLARSPFELLKSAQPWPSGAGPRRAGINGFGFGGTNAHLIVEEFDSDVHAAWQHAKLPSPSSTISLAVVGVGALFPWAKEAKRLRFSPDEIRLPRGKAILPEVQDQMDRAQFLALMAADQALRSVDAKWQKMRDEIAVVLGVQGKTARSLEAAQRIYADLVKTRLADARPDSQAPDLQFKHCAEALVAAMRTVPPSNAYSLPGLMPNVVAGRVANFFDLHGANLSVDAGESSLLEALCAAERMLRRRECKLVLAGGVGANVHAETRLMASSAAGRPVGEAALVLALVTLETAQAEQMPIKAIVSFDGARRSIGAGKTAPAYLMGADGAWEIAAAIDNVQGGALSVEWDGVKGPQRSVRLSAMAEESAATTASEAFGAIRIATTKLERMRPCAAERTNLAAKRLLVVVDSPPPDGLFAGIPHTLICPAVSPVEGAIPVDLSSDESAAKSLRQLDGKDFDVVLVFADLSGAEADLALVEGANGSGVLELLLVAAKRMYPSLQSGRCAVAALTVGSWRGDELDPYTGLLGGFLKSLARELPGCICKAVHSADDATAALNQMAAELGEGPASPVEVGYRSGVRYGPRLKETPPAAGAPKPLLDRESVVVATGGARGVTAALVETVIERRKCRVVLLGRSDPGQLPSELHNLDEVAFDAHEQTFYKNEMARRPGVRIAALRERWEQYRAMREVLATLAQLRANGGRVDYVSVDITDGGAVDRAVREVAARYGRIDFILHGAGIQASRQLQRKTLEEFRRVIATKLGGLRHLQTACSLHFPGHPVHFHLVTSAFSFFGNDGQPDYGAANQAMDRLVRNPPTAGSPAQWSSIAWLGWAGVGMTRGSEYAALARQRGLRPLLRDEGKTLFADFLDGRAIAPDVVQVSDGELRFYGIDLIPRGAPPVASGVAPTDSTWPLSTSMYPFVRDHRVNGVPTLPGTFELELAVRAALAFQPSRRVVSVEDATFDRFVKVQDSSTANLRAKLRVVEQSDHATVVEVTLLSDFIHKSGMVLQQDIRHFSARVRLADEPNVLPAGRKFVNGTAGIAALDPYLAPGSPVKLDGLFRCLETVRLHADHRSASFRIVNPAGLEHLVSFNTPFVLLDAMTRCAVFNVEADGAMRIWVPISAGRTLLPQNVNDASLHSAGAPVHINATAPRFDGDLVFADYVEAVDTDGRVIVIVEGLVARSAGQVQVG